MNVTCSQIAKVTVSGYAATLDLIDIDEVAIDKRSLQNLIEKIGINSVVNAISEMFEDSDILDIFNINPNDYCDSCKGIED